MKLQWFHIQLISSIPWH